MNATTNTKEKSVSQRRPSLRARTTTMTLQRSPSPTLMLKSSQNSQSAATETGEMPVTVAAAAAATVTGEAQGTTTQSAHTRYSATTAALVVGALHDLERIEDVVTISALARRTGLSRPTVRAVLQQECGWTILQSCRAHHAGVRRGNLVQAVAGHPGLAQGRATLQIQGWPNLQRAQQAARTSAYPALQRGRETQAAHGWPSLRAVHESLATKGYPHLAQGRANLAARGWPNWQRAQDVLKAQDYLPLLEAQRLRRNAGYEDSAVQPQPTQQRQPTHQPQQTPADTDRRHLRGRATRTAILEALQTCQAGQASEDQCTSDPMSAGTSARASAYHITARALAARLQLHPATVYAHLKQIRLLTARGCGS